MKFITFFPVLLLLFLSLSGVAFAKDGGHEDGGHDGHAVSEVSSNSSPSESVSSSHEEEAVEAPEAAEVEDAVTPQVSSGSSSVESVSSGSEEGVVEAAEVGGVEDEAAEVDEEGVEANTFEFDGIVTSIVDNTFVVAGETVVIDPTMVSKLEQEGILSVGAMVKVEGVVIGGTNFAQEIKVL